MANINLKYGIKPISYIKTNATEALNYINECKSPIIITQQGVARGVLMDVESYQALIDSVAMMKLVQAAKEDIKAGRTHSHAEVAKEMRAKLKSKYT
ncbi:MAG: type II toxin-antitoxin system Phd/YefM family antitoxin [Campylobacteraceae bacterium]|jgi:PHD/YefM family antitoxin component YafN of YafNO toxin-antitoxin module|nr:type II toxin-antitoxin system Phd/YefM family antitoxin [Campylobacteraceae bacterium]